MPVSHISVHTGSLAPSSAISHRLVEDGYTWLPMTQLPLWGPDLVIYVALHKKRLLLLDIGGSTIPNIALLKVF